MGLNGTSAPNRATTPNGAKWHISPKMGLNGTLAPTGAKWHLSPKWSYNPKWG